MKRVFRLVALMMAVLLALGLAACGAPAANGTSQVAGGSGAAPVNGEKPLLRLGVLPYGPSESYNPAFQTLIDQYNAEEHGATVELDVMSWSGFIEQMQTAIASGNPPDMTTAAYYSLINYAAMGEALDLSSIVEKWKAEKDPILEDFLEGILDSGVYQGQQVAMPLQADGTTIYYRADILEDELGFTDLDKEVSYEKLLEICQAVKDKYGDDMIPLSYFTLDMGSTNAMVNLLYSNGTSWVNSEGTGANLTDPKAVQALEFFGELNSKGYLPQGMVSYNLADIEKLYDSGKVAMIWKNHFRHTVSNPELYENTKLMGPIVGPGADKARLPTWADGIMAFKNTQHPEETKEFIEWFLKNNLPLFVNGGGSGLPMRESYFQDPYYEEDWMLSQYAKYRDYYVDLSWPAPEFPVATYQVFIQNQMGAPIEAVLMGSQDYAGELQKAQDTIDKTFADLS